MQTNIMIIIRWTTKNSILDFCGVFVPFNGNSPENYIPFICKDTSRLSHSCYLSQSYSYHNFTQIEVISVIHTMNENVMATLGTIKYFTVS